MEIRHQYRGELIRTIALAMANLDQIAAGFSEWDSMAKKHVADIVTKQIMEKHNNFDDYPED